MPRPLDHLVLPVADLDRARGHYRALGFTVAPVGRHPFGTANALVLFANRTFLEPIAILDARKAASPECDKIFFVGHLRRFLAGRGEGLALVALKSDDTEADRRRFEAAGFAAGEPLALRRKAVQPDGGEAEVGFVLAFSADRAAPDAALFACQHLAPDRLWRPELLDHPNGAIGIVEVAGVARNPADFHVYLTAATGQRELRATSFGLEARLGGAGISILTPAGFQVHYGLEAPDPGEGLLFSAFEVEVADLARAAGFAGSGAVRQGPRLSLPPTPGRGAVLAFREPSGGPTRRRYRASTTR